MQDRPGCNWEHAGPLHLLGEQLDDVLAFVPLLDLVVKLKSSHLYFFQLLRSSSFWCRYHNTPLQWELAEGRKQMESSGWAVSCLSPSPLAWAPAPLLLLGRDTAAPPSWPNATTPPDAGIQVRGSRSHNILVIPTVLAETQMDDASHCRTWLHSRVVGPTGRWAEVKAFLEEKAYGFYAELQWRPGGRRSDLFTQPLSIGTTLQGFEIYRVGRGRVEWDMPPTVDASNLLNLAQALRIASGAEGALWNALMRSTQASRIAYHMSSVQKLHAIHLADEAAKILPLLAQHLPRMSSEESKRGRRSALEKSREKSKR